MSEDHASTRQNEFIGTIKTVQGFIAKTTSEKKQNNQELFYRGHSDKKYKLEPSLFRKDKCGNPLYLDNEHILYRELLISNSDDFLSDEYTLGKLIRMQHYSLPTRLLDITSNPLIALYFACKSDASEKEIEGEVIQVSISRDQIRYFDSDTVSCIANLARLPNLEKTRINFFEEEFEKLQSWYFNSDATSYIENLGKLSQLDKEEIDELVKKFNNQPPIKRLIHFIKEEKSFFEDRIIPRDLKEIVCVKGKRSNHRISSQSGAFLLFGLNAVLNESGNSDIHIKRVIVKDKCKILKELDLLNINESTVFPYIENSAKYVAKKFQLTN
jgi:hypothetical protein